MDNVFLYFDRFELNKPKSILQIGASSGQEVKLFQSSGIEHAVLVEPLDVPFAYLTQACEGVSNFLPLKALAVATDGTQVNMHVASNFGESSSILKPSKHLAVYPSVKFEQQVVVTDYSADSIYKYARLIRPNLPEWVDMIFLDVQGAELEVLKGAGQLLNHAKYIFTEIGYGGGYEGDVAVEILIQYLAAFSYRPMALELDPRHGYGDALFIRH